MGSQEDNELKRTTTMDENKLCQASMILTKLYDACQWFHLYRGANVNGRFDKHIQKLYGEAQDYAKELLKIELTTN